MEGTAWRFAYLFTQAGLSLGTFAGLALILPTDEFAPATVALGVLVIAGALADLGLSSASTTALPARIAQSPSARGELLSGAVKAYYWAAGLALVLPLIALAGLGHSSQLAVLIIAPAAPAYVLVAAADSILRSEGEFRRPVLLVALNRAGALVSLPVAAVTSSSVWSCGAVGLGTVIATVPAIMVLRSTRSAAPSARASGVIRAALPIGVSQLFVILTGRVNTIILGSVASTAAAAAFETSWRLFQTGQYFAGAVATGIAPFLGNALGAGRGADLNRLLMRSMGIVTCAGVLFSGALLAIRRPVADILAEGLANDVSRTILPLAIVGPIAFAGFVGTMALAASDADRHILLVANAVGAALNLGLAIPLVPAHGAPGAGLACAIGIGVTQTIIFVRVVMLSRRVRYVLPAAAQQPTPAATMY
jgi:O-antigen/teichoic acid export membrane protein